MKNIVLILGNPLNHEGGMVAFNKGIISTLNNGEKDYRLKHFSIGSRMSLFYYPIFKKILYPLLLASDLIRFCFTLLNKNIKIIQLNPSLIPVPLIRDGFVQFINILIFKKKTVIVLHGWKEQVFNKINNNRVYSLWVKKFLNSSDFIYVLSQDFKSKLVNLGVTESKIILTTTFFYKKDIETLSKSKSKTNPVKFIFLGRVSKLKGITELISAFYQVNKTRSNFTCDIVGHGDGPNSINNFQKLLSDNNLSKKIKFLGRKTGKEKFNKLITSDIYLLPSYMEGCPTTAIEALACGLFVISTDVGALNDIITDNNGIKVKPYQIDELAKAILKSINEIEVIRSKRNRISENTFLNFEVNIISEQFHNTYENLMKVS